MLQNTTNTLLLFQNNKVIILNHTQSLKVDNVLQDSLSNEICVNTIESLRMPFKMIIYIDLTLLLVN